MTMLDETEMPAWEEELRWDAADAQDALNIANEKLAQKGDYDAAKEEGKAHSRPAELLRFEDCSWPDKRCVCGWHTDTAKEALS